MLPRRSSVATLVIALTALTASCAAAEVDPSAISRAPAPIIEGRTAPDDPGVVYVARVGGGGFGGCTGTLLAPRVVLTAKHCVVDLPAENLFPECFGSALGYTPVAARNMFAGVGDTLNGLMQVQSAEEVRLTGLSELVVGDDVALLILRRPLSAPVYPYATVQPEPGETVRIVGYGIRDITGRGPSGERYQVEDEVIRRGTCTTEQEFDVGGPSVCQGDSGGPAFNAAGEVTGVVSRGAPDNSGNQCGGESTFSAVAAHVEWIEQALRDTGVCIPEEGGERCDGIDNDCDDEVDEDCDPPGTPCESGATCLGATCEPVAADGSKVCTAPCHPFASGQAVSGLAVCPTGLYCRAVGCEGWCVPGVRGALPEAATCTRDTDCASLHCIDPGDGVQRCLYPCQGAHGQCGLGEVCSQSTEGTCGACVPAAESSAVNQLGEPCDDATEVCAAGLSCVEDGDRRYCATACGEGAAACPEGYHCRGSACVRGEPQPNGAPCEANEDCVGGACATQHGHAFCTGTCGECAPGLSCEAVSGVQICVPTAAFDGETCEADADCVSGLCGSFEGERVCARACGPADACSAGNDCIEDDARRLTCRAPTPVVHAGGGCAVGGAGSASSLGLLLIAFAAWLLRSGRRERLEGEREERR